MQNKSVFLPKTSFAIRANLFSKEQLILDNWRHDNLYKVIREKSKKYPKFILQDGPPFANGKPHMGTAFNRIIKDVVLRYKQMQGYDAPFIPGWDCHGLPIEWKVFENNAGEDLSISEFRNECRNFAKGWIDVQRNIFKRLGTIADWDNPYITMDKKSESIIVSNLFNLLKDGAVYMARRPVLWSVVEKTALADAEVEYKDKISTSIYVGFRVVKSDYSMLIGTYVVIWTTTPWTIPCNRAVSYSNKESYLLIDVKSKDSIQNKRMIVAKGLLNDFLEKTGVDKNNVTVLETLNPKMLKDVMLSHPLLKHGYSDDIPLIHGDHVSADTGTGFVHTAPSHGLDDFYVSSKYGIKADDTVDENGFYTGIIPYFNGKHIFKVEDEIIEALRINDTLFGINKINHSYPHSWRSKSPLIYRATSQWFISLDKTGIREKALKEIENVKWFPQKGKNRISSFVENRKDWCISRQRKWGIPLAFFVDKNKKPLVDEDVFKKTIDIINEKGSDAWFTLDKAEFLCGKYKPEDYEKITDIVDVWIESGSAFAYVTKERKELAFPADLYLEGSDQHRGWFQSSLLLSVATTGVAPYKSVLTHGFIVDENGMKMSKSLGNVVDPEDIIKDSGADVMRIWCVNNDYTEDMKIGPNIIEQQKDLYKKLRNMFRYILGALDGFDNDEIIPYDSMTNIDKYILARIYNINNEINQYIENFDIKNVFITLKNFCLKELSSFYFDIRKDCLYCDPKNSLKRRGYRTVLDILFKFLTKSFAPILVFTSEEAWRTRYLGELFPSEHNPMSVHTEVFDVVPKEYNNSEIIKLFDLICDVRSAVLSELENARQNKMIAASLEASVEVYLEDKYFALSEFISESEMEDFVISSSFKFVLQKNDSFHEVIPGIFVRVTKQNGEKCPRCWKIKGYLTQSGVCDRCDF